MDWRGEALGSLRGAFVDARTRDVDALLVALEEGARARLGLGGPDLVVPARCVASVRRDEVALDRSLGALRRDLGPLAPRA